MDVVASTQYTRIGESVQGARMTRQVMLSMD